MKNEIAAMTDATKLFSDFAYLTAYYNHPRRQQFIKQIAEDCVSISNRDRNATVEDIEHCFAYYLRTEEGFKAALHDWKVAIKRMSFFLPSATAGIKPKKAYQEFCKLVSALVPLIIAGADLEEIQLKIQETLFGKKVK